MSDDAAAKVTGPEWRMLRVQIVILALVMAAILSIGAALHKQASRSIDRLLASSTAARLQVNAASDVLDALQDAESAQRGFLMTLRPAYLEPYQVASAKIGPSLDRLVALSRDTPWLQQEATELRMVADRKVTELARTVALAQSGDVKGALDIVVTDEGRTLMDDLRRRVDRIAAQAESARTATVDKLQAEQRFLINATQVSLAVGVLLLGSTLLLVLWNRAQLVRTQRAERVLAARLEAAVGGIRDGIAVFDASGRLILRNDRFGPALDLAPGMARRGLPWADLASAVSLEPPVLQSALAPPQPVSSEARQGARTLEIWRSTMPEGGQILAVADITRRVQAEDIARQAQKMEVLGQMTGGVAHDFNNLLQVVSANLELITNRIARAETKDTWLQTRLEAARAGVARGARLTRHLLAFARRQPLAPEALDPARVLRGLEDTLRRTLGGLIDLELVVGGDLWAIRADPNQLENALLNLALNARDAMAAGDPVEGEQPGGHLTIEAANASLDEAYAARTAEVTPGQYVMFAVTDTGLGMTAEQIARATEPFYTTKAEGQGTGLGLSMVFGFAKQSGGHFQLYSEPGQGTTARLYIPRTMDAVGDAPDATLDAGPGKGELVLLVEDDAPVRQASADTLRGMGYAVLEAGDADAALALLRGGARPDILFTDVVMPGRLTSRALAEQAMAMLPRLAVLFTSGYTQNAIVHNGQLDPGINLISKPWRAEDLARELRAALDQPQTSRPAPPPRRVLLVADETVLRKATAGMLADMGFDVLEASSGAEALAHLEGGVDVLLTDFGLPDMEGLTLAAWARARHLGIAVVIASGPAPAPAAHGYVWLTEPCDKPTLRAALEQAMAGT